LSLKKNLIANYFGVAWSALMSVAFLPFYLHFIGVEGYGLVGFFVMLSASLTILDAGLGSVATREAAAYIGSNNERQSEIVLLLRSIEILLFGVSLITGLVVIFAAPLIVKYWLNVPVELVSGATWAICWMGLTIAIQFPSSYYSGCLNGFQRQVSLNVVNVVGSTLRGGGAVLVLWLISPTIQAFFAWQAFGALGMLIAFRVLFIRSLLETPIDLVFSSQSIKRVRHFLGGMGAINILALLLTQLDKLILSKVLTLTAFGYYTLAWMLGTLIYRLTGPVFNAYYPKITQLLEQKNSVLMLHTYQQACKVMAVVVVPISLWLALFSHDILQLWTRNATLANEASGALSVIAIGTMFNAFMHIPYALQLAHSYTRLALVQNIIAVILLAPLTWFLATHYGLTFAALPWLIVNAGYVIFSAPLMHWNLALPGLREWYVKSLLKPIFYSGFIMTLFKVLWVMSFGHQFVLILLPITLITGFLITIFNSQLLSLSILRQWKNILQ